MAKVPFDITEQELQDLFDKVGPDSDLFDFFGPTASPAGGLPENVATGITERRAEVNKLPSFGDLSSERKSLGSSLEDFEKRLDFISNLPIFDDQGVKIPPEQLANLRKMNEEIRTLSQDLIAGKIPAFQADPSLRTNLIDQARGTFGRELERSQEASFEDLSRRGLFPTGQTGFSGPAAEVLAKQRAQTFEDPLTSFIRQFDIQQEQTRIDQLVNNRNTGIGFADVPFRNEFGLAEFQANLGLQNETNKNNLLNNLLGQELSGEQLDQNAFQSDRNLQLQLERFDFERQLARKEFEFQEEALRIARKSGGGQSSTGGTIGGIAGGIFGGYLGGPAGAAAGSSIGSSLFGNDQQRQNAGAIDLSPFFKQSQTQTDLGSQLPQGDFQNSGFNNNINPDSFGFATGLTSGANLQGSKFRADPFQSTVSFNNPSRKNKARRVI